MRSLPSSPYAVARSVGLVSGALSFAASDDDRDCRCSRTDGSIFEMSGTVTGCSCFPEGGLSTDVPGAGCCAGAGVCGCVGGGWVDSFVCDLHAPHKIANDTTRAAPWTIG